MKKVGVKSKEEWKEILIPRFISCWRWKNGRIFADPTAKNTRQVIKSIKQPFLLHSPNLIPGPPTDFFIKFLLYGSPEFNLIGSLTIKKNLWTIIPDHTLFFFTDELCVGLPTELLQHWRTARSRRWLMLLKQLRFFMENWALCVNTGGSRCWRGLRWSQLSMSYLRNYCKREKHYSRFFNRIEELLPPTDDNFPRDYWIQGSTTKERRMQGEVDRFKEKLSTMKSQVVSTEINAITQDY